MEPGAFGITGVTVGDLAGGGPEDNAALIVQILEGRGPVGATAAVTLNAAAAIYVSGVSPSLEAAMAAARDAIQGGAAGRKRLYPRRKRPWRRAQPPPGPLRQPDRQRARRKRLQKKNQT
mgnify:CR=1 FL=1